MIPKKYIPFNFVLIFQIKTLSFSLDIIQTTLIKKMKPGVVRVYDYYEPGTDSVCGHYTITVRRDYHFLSICTNVNNNINLSECHIDMD